MDKKLAQLKNNFVQLKEFEYKTEELKNKINDNQDTQQQYNDGV